MSSETFGVHPVAHNAHLGTGLHRSRRSSIETEDSEPSHPSGPDEGLSVLSRGSVDSLMDELCRRQDQQLTERLREFGQTHKQELAEQLDRFSQTHKQELVEQLDRFSKDEDRKIQEHLEAFGKSFREDLIRDIRDGMHTQGSNPPTSHQPPAISYPQSHADEDNSSIASLEFRLTKRDVSKIIEEWASVAVEQLKDRIAALERQPSEAPPKPFSFFISKRKSASNLKVIDSYPSPSSPPLSLTLGAARSVQRRVRTWFSIGLMP